MNPESRLPDTVADALRALRQDTPPARDLWPGIASRLQPREIGRPGVGPAEAAHSVAAAAPAAAADPAAVATVAGSRAMPHALPRHGRRRNLAYAAAAAVVLSVAAGSQFLPLPEATFPGPGQVGPAPLAAGGAADPAAPSDPVVGGVDPSPPLLQAADALAREYQGALREIQASAAISAAAAGPGFRTPPADARLAADLERSAREVRAALARDPDALHLFHRLQDIYSHRLALSLHQAPPEEFHS